MTQQYHSLAYAQKDLTYYTDSCSIMFIAAVFTVARKWKQTKYCSVDKWVMKMEHINTVGYYSAVKKKSETMNFADKWMKLEKIILSEVTQFQKNKCPIRDS